MNVHDLEYSLVVNPPTYHRVLFGFPWWREERLRRLNLYNIQQLILNPENIPHHKKTSLYRISPKHLDLWIEDSFVNNFDQPAFESLAFAWSRAQQANIPFMDACNVHFNRNTLDIAPITSHATLTEISHIGICLYRDKNIPDLHFRSSRDKFHKTFTDDLTTLQSWLLECMLRLSNLLYNYTAASELLTKYIRTQLYKWQLFPNLRLVVVYFTSFLVYRLDSFSSSFCPFVRHFIFFFQLFYFDHETPY